jgi:SAM-dependent methyltransferase
MIDRYKARIDELGPRHKDTQAVVGNLLSNPVELQSLVDNEFFDFDLITLGAALHAFPDPEHAVKALAERLRPGGVLYVQDKFDDGGERGEEAKGPKGFTEAGVRALMRGAGLNEFGFELVEGETQVELPSEEVVNVKLFTAKGKKSG